MRGKEGNALFIGPRNRVSEITRAIQKLTRGGSFGKQDRHNRPTNGFATCGSQKIKTWLKSYKYALNHDNILDDPLNKGATDGIAKN